MVSAKDTAKLLDRWQAKIKGDTDEGIGAAYAFPSITRFVIVQMQEYLNVLERVGKIVNPEFKPLLRHSFCPPAKDHKAPARFTFKSQANADKKQGEEAIAAPTNDKSQRSKGTATPNNAQSVTPK